MVKTKKKRFHPYEGLTDEEKKMAKKAYWQRNICIFVMMIPVVAWFLVFSYWPLYYLRMAFYDYKYIKGFSGSEFVGLENFIKFFRQDGLTYVWNTLAINILALIFLFPFPIILAILFNELSNAIFRKTAQTVSYLPHFLSTTALVGIIYLVFDSDAAGGLINHILVSVFKVNQENFLSSEKWFRSIQVISGIWQTAGWSTIVYTAALTAIDPQLYEAARVESASRWHQIRTITLPALVPTILIMLTLQLGCIMGSNFDKIQLLQNAGNIKVSEVVLTFIYSQGIREPGYGTAVGLLNSVVGLIFVIASNKISKKMANTSVW